MSSRSIAVNGLEFTVSSNTSSWSEALITESESLDRFIRIPNASVVSRIACLRYEGLYVIGGSSEAGG